MSASSLLLLLSLLFQVRAAQFTLHHRVVHPLLPPQPYTQRAALSLAGDQPLVHNVPSLSQDLLAFSNIPEPLDLALYQIALEHEGDQSQDDWDVSSVKLCHLPQTASETLFLHLADDGKPYALDYFVSPIPHDGSCPKSTQAPNTSALAAFSARVQNLNTTILLRGPSSPPLPILNTPPPLTPEGQVVQPPPEKSFLQKYWFYIAIALFVMVFTGGPEEEGQAGARK